MTIFDLLGKELNPLDVQGAFEDLIDDLTNPTHSKNDETPAVMMRLLMLLENANEDMRAYLIEKAQEYAFLHTDEFRAGLKRFKGKAASKD